ncbi:ATP-dependent DNA helicase [Paenibacillus urinalis]|uniref:ATP-dependent DNA helicase n=1 Tax=Paenibacillus urinalis TaxID=521520 RepID=A0AAX3MUV7_9BACL|nr:ATP-dependent DNA helicase [Paenibacillus urinalis]WDH81400.1 ATP-dependent DNA helicase [Paenibacillus urinalis]
MERYPFSYNPTEPFVKQVGDWVADVFYDMLPEHGFEVRDEQIYMAYQLERAYADKKTIFAEAGVGTGKTLVYLLYAVNYARYTRKPAVIACADESLIEQLVKPEGDIAKLARYLGLNIDARLGKSPDQYICLKKMDGARLKDEDADVIEEVYDSLPDFVHSPGTLQTFSPYGDRKEYPHLNDEQWDKISWDSFQDCFVCDKRHRCGMTLSRDHYRKSTDLIICSHDYYMEHVWTYEGRKREGQLPLLPEHSSVVFDEGHLLESAAQHALSYKLKHTAFEEMITRLLDGEIRETLAERVEDAIDQSKVVFSLVQELSTTIPGSDRKRVGVNEALLIQLNRWNDTLEAIDEELVFESGLHTLNEYKLRIVEEHLEMIQTALQLFRQPGSYICWAEESEDGDVTLAVMPQKVKEVLEQRVFGLNMPIVFSSATLSVGQSFDYVADSLGITDYLSFSVNSPYNYADQMRLIVPEELCEAGELRSEVLFAKKLASAAKLLAHSEGRALLLFTTMEELRRFKQAAAQHPYFASYKMLFEGDREISSLIADFQNNEETVLCATSLWEGLDVPGPSLSNVMIWSLPYPPEDPVFMAKREAAESSYEEVDMPYMLLRLRQGLGRLIRSSSDQGIAAVLDPEIVADSKVRERVEAVLPQGAALRVEKI